MRVVIFANGQLESQADLRSFHLDADLLIAADGGANHCDALGLLPDILIGDLDSISPALLESYQTRSVEVHRHPAEKNATDLELALDLALKRGASQVMLIGVLGGRWDMSISNIMLVAADCYKNLSITLVGRDCTMRILHPGREHCITGRLGDTISLLPLSGAARGVTLSGFAYPLSNQQIDFGSSRGVSNILKARQASVWFREGVLLCIRQL